MAANIDIKMRKGDTYPGVTFTITETATGDAIDLTDNTGRMEIRADSKTGTAALTLTTGDGLTLTDAAAGKISIDAFDCDLDAGDYWYDIQLTDAGVITTYVQGRILVEQDITQPAT